MEGNRGISTYESIQLWLNKVTFAVQSAMYVGMISIAIHGVLALALSLLFYSEAYKIISGYIYLNVTAFRVPDLDYLVRAGKWLLWKNLAIIIVTAGSYFVSVPLLLSRTRRLGEKTTETKYIRGVKLLNEYELAKEIKKSRVTKGIRLTDTLYIPTEIETGHLGIVGATGSGKTQTINRMITSLKERDVKMVIHDMKGDFFSTFGESGDIFFNPLDTRHMGRYGGWTIFSSIRDLTDIELVASALVPHRAEDKQPFFQNAARQLLVSILRFCHFSGKTTNKHIYQTMTLPPTELASLLQGMPGGEIGYQFMQTKEAPSIVSTLVNNCYCLQYLADTDGDFIIEDWVRNGKGSIYIANYPKIKDALKNINSLFIDLLIRRTLDLEADLNRRSAFILDEVAQLGKQNSLIDLLTLSRDRGGVNILGYQTNSTLRAIYGREDTTTILGNVKSKIVCQLADDETAEYYSSFFGKVEEVRTVRSHSVRSGGENDGVNFNEQFHERKVITADDLKGLRVFSGKYYECFVKLANYNPAGLEMQIIKYPQKQEALVKREGINLDAIKQQAQAAQEKLDAVQGIHAAQKNEEEQDRAVDFSYFE